MILNGIGRLVRDYPHVPGIDFRAIMLLATLDIPRVIVLFDRMESRRGPLGWVLRKGSS